MKVCGVAQLAAAQISDTGTPRKRAQDVAIPLVECAFNCPGGGRPADSYANLIASTIQWERRCLDNG